MGSEMCIRDRGAYFFWEYEGYCNCPTDDCELGYENENAGGSGQLYRSDCGDEDEDGDEDGDPASTEVRGGGYEVSGGPMTFSSCENHCASLGGTVACVTSDADETALDALRAEAACGQV